MKRFLLSAQGWPYLLTPFIAVAVGLELAHAEATLIFAAAALGIIPTAALMGLATEELAARSGPGIGGFLNVTFGNAAELIIAIFLLAEGLQEVVKASIIGSILGNLLLVLGLAMLVGGIGRAKQTFNRVAANAQASMLFLAVAALIMPAIYALVAGGGLPAVDVALVDFGEGEFGDDLEELSIGVAIVLMFTYGAGLLFSLRTHKDVFNPMGEDGEAEAADGHGHGEGFGWSVRRSVGMLAIAGAAVAIVSEILVGSISEASESIGISEFFVGIIIVAVVGNAAEHWVAVMFARKDKMDLAVNISIGSAAQIALFVAPILVLLSFVIGPNPMPLVLNGFELGAVLVAVLIAAYVTQEGESNWFEGVQLLAVYVVLALAFLYA